VPINADFSKDTDILIEILIFLREFRFSNVLTRSNSAANWDIGKAIPWSLVSARRPSTLLLSVKRA
jgi:hypothetical protein